MRGHKLTFLALTLLTTVGCDQATKVMARQHLDGAGTTSYLGDTFRLTYAENSGAFLGMGASLPDGVRLGIFVGLVSLFLVGITVWLLRQPQVSRVLLLAVGLVIGGGVGNLIDRVVFDGHVTDFLNMGIGSLRTGIFNVADIWIMVGVGLMLLAPELRNKPPEASPPEGASP